MWTWLSGLLQRQDAVRTIWACVTIVLLALVLHVIDPLAGKVANLPSPTSSVPAEPYTPPNNPANTLVPSPGPGPAPMDLDATLREQENKSFLTKLDQLVEQARGVAVECRTFQTSLRGLATNDEGRRIANDAQATAGAIALMSDPPVRISDVDDMVERIDQFRQDITTGLERDRSQVVTTYARSKLTELQSALEKTQNATRQAQRALTRIVSSTAHLQPGSQTLAQAAERDQEEKAQALIEAVRQAKEAAHQEKIKLAVEIEKKQGQEELERMRTQAEADRQKAIAEADAKRTATEKAAADAQLLAEFERDWPQIQHYLGTLFIPGQTQPTGRGLVFEVTLESKPVSLAGIKAYGALRQDAAGLGTLLFLFNATSNDRREQSPYPLYIGGALQPGHIAAAKPALELLTKYQYLLVEKGLLSP